MDRKNGDARFVSYTATSNNMIQYDTAPGKEMLGYVTMNIITVS
jgi:hypothetical protein